MNDPLKIILISTGGTIEKTYSELEGILHNEYSVLDVILEGLRCEGITIIREPLMNKDSLNITPSDLQHIIDTVSHHALNNQCDGIVIVHGTDRLTFTGEHIFQFFKKDQLKIPIVLTGAMRPYMLRNTDAIQNLTEALLAIQLLSPGVYSVMHNRILKFPNVVKNRQKMTFEKYN